eukprot:scaffold13422_cov26-Tisochrysis_lutea.AAC.1
MSTQLREAEQRLDTNIVTVGGWALPPGRGESSQEQSCNERFLALDNRGGVRRRSIDCWLDSSTSVGSLFLVYGTRREETLHEYSYSLRSTLSLCKSVRGGYS